jgi:hypothetical protein
VQPISLANNPDEFVRKQLDVLRLTGGENAYFGTRSAARDAGVLFPDPGARYVSVGDTYYRISGGSGMRATSALMQQLALKAQFTRGQPGINEIRTGEKVWALMRFDGEATFVGLAIEGANGIALHHSCHASLTGAAPGPGSRGRRE